MRPGDPVEFRAKTWMYRVAAFFMALFASFSLILGPLFLTGRMKNARDEPAEEAGLMLTLWGVASTLLLAQSAYGLWVRRRPLLRICREGVEALMIGESSLDRIPLVPGLVRIAWSILSGQGFRSRIVRIPWARLDEVVVQWTPRGRVLAIVGTTDAGAHESLYFGDYSLKRPLDEIAEAVSSRRAGFKDPATLRSWDDPGLFFQ